MIGAKWWLVHFAQSVLLGLDVYSKMSSTLLDTLVRVFISGCPASPSRGKSGQLCSSDY